jgi:penicillin-binding protein 1C
LPGLLPKHRRRILILAACGVLLGTAAGLDRAFPPPLTRYQARAIAVLGSEATPLDVAIAPDGYWRLPATVVTASPIYLKLLLATEDKRFYSHPGVDPLALARAGFQLLRHGHIVSGGSTLTMQAARLLSPHRHDILGKIEDIARALQLERRYSKQQILAIYLTLAPEGGNIEGVEAASLSYFGKRADALSPAEAALLVALPRLPVALDPLKHRQAAERAARQVLDRAGLGAAWGAGLTALGPHPWPSLAPHLAARLRAAGDSGFVQTTLSAAAQRMAVDLLRRRVVPEGAEANAATLILRNRDRAVLAYVGGVDFMSAHGGMVDMTRRLRSPGSALKPFIYGIALDDALIVPDTLMQDTPARFGDWAPADFDRRSLGAVTARYALQQSLNLPAVALMRAVGPARVAATLKTAAARLVLPPGATPSLALVLGGVGIRLEDMAMLYAGIAEGGKALPIHMLAPAQTADAKPMPGVELMSAAAAATIGDILRTAPVPDGVSPDRARPIAYKTGTSYDFRDAWAAGFSADYTIVVWTGRTDGTPRPDQYGREAAAPLLFALFDGLPPDVRSVPSPPKEPPLAALAPALRRFLPESALAETSGQPPRILFPPDGATINASEDDGTMSPVGLEAGGGRPPYRWFVDGVPLSQPPVGGSPNWTPDSAGFVTLSLVDGRDDTATAHIRVQ